MLVPRLLVRVVQPARKYAICCPPSVRVSFAEKCFHGTLMSMAFLGVPMVGLYMIPKWRDENKHN